jgi:hypothetical protein
MFSFMVFSNTDVLLLVRRLKEPCEIPQCFNKLDIARLLKGEPEAWNTVLEHTSGDIRTSVRNELLAHFPHLQKRGTFILK